VPSTDRLAVWQVAGRPDALPAPSAVTCAMAQRTIDVVTMDPAGPIPNERPDLVHVYGMPRGLERSWPPLLATVPYIVTLTAADLTHRGRRRWNQGARRLLQGAQVVLVPEAELLWLLAAIRHLPPTRVVPDLDGGQEHQPSVIDLRDDGSLLGDWGFGIWAESGGPASTLASIYRHLA
jgi:hypothetical protein